MLQVYLLLGILGLLYVKSNKNNQENTESFSLNLKKPKNLDYASVPEQIEKAKEVQKNIDIEKKQQQKLNKLESKTEDEPKVETFKSLTGNLIETKSFLTRTDGTKIEPNFVKERGHLGQKDSRFFEKFTATDKYSFKKKETTPFFLHRENRDVNLNNLGSTVNNQLQTRDNTIRNKNNELPFQQVLVGSGLNQGFDEGPKGGFHQYEIQELMKPKTIDELRPLSNPKLTFRGRVLKGKNINDKRTKVGELFKNRTTKTFALDHDRGVSGGVIEKDMIRSKFVMPLTNRITSKQLSGGLKGNLKLTRKQILKPTTKNIFKAPKVDNKYNPNSWTAGKKLADYGKSSMKQYPNERDVTQKRTYTSNVLTAVKSLMAPLLDKAKVTKKQHVEVNLNPFGNMKRAAPNKLTSYDPNDIARTTIKETTIDNNRHGNLKGDDKYAGYTYEDLPKITIRNTVDNVENNANVKGRNKRTANPLQELKTTIKETTERNENILGPSREEGDAYKYIKIKMKNTNKQFTSDNDYTGIAGGAEKAMMNQVSAKNQRLNLDKERVARGRSFTPSGPKDAVNKGDITVVLKKQMSEIPSEPPRLGLKEIAVSGDTRPQLNLKKHTQGTEYNKNKIDPNLLKAFKENPYTKPLDSYTFATKVSEIQKQPDVTPKHDENEDEFEKLLSELTYN